MVRALLVKKYSRTCLIRYFFVGPGRIPIFCEHFCSSNW